MGCNSHRRCVLAHSTWHGEPDRQSGAEWPEGPVKGMAKAASRAENIQSAGVGLPARSKALLPRAGSSQRPQCRAGSVRRAPAEAAPHRQGPAGGAARGLLASALACLQGAARQFNRRKPLDPLGTEPGCKPTAAGWAAAASQTARHGSAVLLERCFSGKQQWKLFSANLWQSRLPNSGGG